ncbi:MAG TPA: SET domain-containing protein [Devosia sp.]|nr:SET domain-containing protein [Devosia sp.]
MPKAAPKKSYTPGDFNLKVRRARTGLGLFAETDIPKGACIIEYVGRVLTDEEYDRSRSRYLFDLGNGKVLEGATRANKARYINHSCRPNCESEVHKGRIFIHAIKKVRAGDELVYNYGKEYFEAYLGENCLCPKCSPVELAVAAE